MINVATSAAAAFAQRPYQLVAERILGLIRQAGLAPGSRLPPERELGAALAIHQVWNKKPLPKDLIHLKHYSAVKEHQL